MPINTTSASIQALGSFTFTGTPNDAPTKTTNFINTVKKQANDQLLSTNPFGSINAEVVLKSACDAPKVENTKIILIKDDQKMIMPECIIENKKNGKVYTTVKWNDGTYTAVKVSEEDSTAASTYMAFCAALAKKIYGTNAKVHRMVDRHTLEYIKAQKAKADNEKRLKQQEEEHRIHHRKVLAAAKRMRIKEEAKKYMKTHEFECCCEND